MIRIGWFEPTTDSVAAVRQRVELSVDRFVRIEVTDRAIEGPRVGLVTPHPSQGLGLQVVAGLCTRWGVDWLYGGKVVWAEVALDAE